MLQPAYWNYKKYPAMIGEKPVEIQASQHKSEKDKAHGLDAEVVLFCYEGKKNIYALRWSLGAVLNMGTNDMEEAVGGIEAMRSMEASSNAAR